MTTARPAQRVEWIAIDRITVVNPRSRNKRAFKDIVDNIAQIGLKRPITVTRRVEADGPFYDLVCGQGRLEAYQALGQSEVPALVVMADPEDCLISSLVENCARRQHRTVELLQDIGRMRERGDSVQDIARKTGLSADYVYAVAQLLQKGEQRLLHAVETGLMPISVAVDIAASDDHGIQRALQDAYEKGLLRGKKLLAAKRLVEKRHHAGKGLKFRISRSPEKLSSAALVRAYQHDSDRQREMIRRARGTHDQLVFITEALRRLKADEQLVALLEDEDLSTMPENLAVRLSRTGPDAK
jgi:ParB family transcriptional regulator, chromosome partitioning protein